MSGKYAQEYVKVTTHKFKTHLSHYLRMLEADMCRAVIVRRGNEDVAMVLPLNRDYSEYRDEEEEDEDDEWLS